MRGVNRKLASLAAAALLPLLSMPVPAQRRERKSAERAEISLLEQQWREAQISENIGEMDRLLAEDFLGITAAGQVVTKTQQLERMRTRHIDLQRVDISDSKIRISGNVAVVTSLAQVDGTVDGHALDGSFRYTRVYQRGPANSWQITNFEATRVPGSDPAHRAKTPAAVGAGPHAGGPNFLPASQAAPGSPPPPS